MYKNHKIIDGHVHYILDCEPEYFVSLLDRTGTDIANLAAISHGSRLSCAPEELALKAMYPGRFYVCGSIDPCIYSLPEEEMGAALVSHATRSLAMGCDGIKLLEGKPQLRRAFPIPDFDRECWEPFWSYMEENSVPLLWHVNDPEEFWDKSKVPAWAANLGWEYDSSYINNEEQYRQVLAVLARHPGLRVTFAHMFFMSAQLPRLSAIMDAYPNVRVDLTPGIEMYDNLSKTGEETRAFFKKYHDRIIYGTDIGSRFVYTSVPKPFNELENLRRPEIVQHYLICDKPEIVGSDGNFVHDRPDFVMDCLGLKGERLDEVLSLNFLRFIGGEPKSVNIPLVLEECARLRTESESADTKGLDLAEKYLRKLL